MKIPVHVIMLPRPSSEADERRFNGEDIPHAPSGSEIIVNGYDGEVLWHPLHVGLLFPRDLDIGWRPTIAHFLNATSENGVVFVHAGVLDRLLAERSMLPNELKSQRTLIGGTVLRTNAFKYIYGLAWSRDWGLQQVSIDFPLNMDEPFLVDYVRSKSVSFVL